MSEHNAEGRLDPQGLRLADLARVLSAMGPRPVTVAMLEADIAAGAPTNPDGTVSLIQYGAWLVKEITHRGD